MLGRCLQRAKKKALRKRRPYKDSPDNFGDVSISSLFIVVLRTKSVFFQEFDKWMSADCFPSALA